MSRIERGQPSDVEVAGLGTVLAVWAHPDDEAYLAGGLLARAADAGCRVVCVTATHGEHGTADPLRWPPPRLRAVRERELVASLAALGVREHHWLGIEDGTCAAASPIAPVATVTRLIREIRPDTVVTFGPDGMTGHRDHRAVSQWTTRAWAASGANGRLLYAASSTEFAGRYRWLHDRFGMFDPGLPAATPEGELAVRLRLHGELLDRKVVALRAHASQTAALVAAMGEDLFREWCAEESFVTLPSSPPWAAARTPAPGGARPRDGREGRGLAAVGHAA